MFAVTPILRMGKSFTEKFEMMGIFTPGGKLESI